MNLFWWKPKSTVEPATASDNNNLQNWRWCHGGAPGELVHFFRPGEEGRRHVVTMVLATLKKGGSQLLTVQDGDQMIVRNYCHGMLKLSGCPIRTGESVQITLNCFEDPENVSSLTVWGYTEDKDFKNDDKVVVLD